MVRAKDLLVVGLVVVFPALVAAEEITPQRNKLNPEKQPEVLRSTARRPKHVARMPVAHKDNRHIATQPDSDARATLGNEHQPDAKAIGTRKYTIDNDAAWSVGPKWSASSQSGSPAYSSRALFDELNKTSTGQENGYGGGAEFRLQF